MSYILFFYFNKLTGSVSDRNGSVIMEHGEVIKQFEEYFRNIFESNSSLFYFDSSNDVEIMVDNKKCDCESEMSMDVIMNAIKIMKMSKYMTEFIPK